MQTKANFPACNDPARCKLVSHAEPGIRSAGLRGRLKPDTIRWRILALLFFATVINFVDRQTLSIIAPELTREFGMSGTQYGMIVAFLFQAGLYSVGFMADQHSAIFGMGRIFVGIILIPVMLVCGSFVWSGLVHLCLMLAGGARKPFETTFRVVCFSTGSTHLLAMVPFCGRLVAPIYNIVLQCMGLARAHETDTGKAVIAVLLPIIVCCGGLMLVAILGGFSALSLFSRH